jgi:hypothetical protein
MPSLGMTSQSYNHLYRVHYISPLKCGVVARDPGYISRDPGFDSSTARFWEIVGLDHGPVSLVTIIEE